MNKLSLFILFIPFLAKAAVIPAPVTHLFIPTGFDDNDSVEFVVSGYFPDTCYSKNRVDVQVEKNTIKVDVTAIQHEKKNPYDLAMCSQMIIPFYEVITVGQLDKANYNVIVNGKTRHELTGSVSIIEASSNQIDDYLYAHLSYIEVNHQDPTQITLVGMRPSDCIEIDRVEFIKNGKDVLAILPIMKQTRQHCPMKMTPYKIPVKVDYSGLNHREVLLYARSMEGKSVSSIVRNAPVSQ